MDGPNSIWASLQAESCTLFTQRLPGPRDDKVCGGGQESVLDEDDRPLAAPLWLLLIVPAARDPVHLEDVLVLRDGRVRLHRVLVPRRDRRLEQRRAYLQAT